MNIPSTGIESTPSSANRINTLLASVDSILHIDGIDFKDAQIGQTIYIPEGKILHLSRCSNVGFSFRNTGDAALIIDGCFLTQGTAYFDYLLDINNSVGELKYTLRSSYNSVGRPLDDTYWQVLGGLS